jgi:hypothetical protein
VSNEAATASRLLTRYGETVTVETPETGGFNPITGEPSDGEPGTIYTGKGYPGRYQKGEVNGTTIQSGDIRLVLELLEQRPQVGWSVTVDSSTYRIMDVNPIRKTGADVIYICQLRSN